MKKYSLKKWEEILVKNKIIRLSLSEISITAKTVYFKLMVLLATIYCLSMYYVKPDRMPIYFAKNVYPVMTLLIILVGARVLGRDFRNKISNQTFTGIYSKKQIILSKIISMAILGVVIWLLQLAIFGIFATLIKVKGNSIGIMEMIDIRIVHMLVYDIFFSTLIGSFLILISVITFKTLPSLIIGILNFFILNSVAHSIVYAVEKGFSDKDIIYRTLMFLPQGVFGYWKGEFDIIPMSIIAIYIVIQTILAMIIIDKKEIMQRC